jgi:hypothetical protein
MKPSLAMLLDRRPLAIPLRTTRPDAAKTVFRSITPKWAFGSFPGEFKGNSRLFRLESLDFPAEPMV